MRTSALFRLSAAVFFTIGGFASVACVSSRTTASPPATAAASSNSASVSAEKPRETPADWPMFGHDPARSSFAEGEVAISVGNINKLHRRWVAHLDAPADSAPILISNVTVSGKKLNMLFVTSRNG